MSSLRETEKEESNDPEITLSTASLLGIFVGLVLICGVFFGFGYSMGRRATANPPATASASNSSDAADAPVTQHMKARASAAAPEDSETASTASSAASSVASREAEQSPAAVTLPIVEDSDTPKPAEAKQRPSAAHIQEAPAKPSATQSYSAPTPAASAQRVSETRPGMGGTMVQLAAVSRQEDADVLVSALRQRGYSVMVRNEPQDKLLHVQVGPFASRADAATMKQKLLSDGYNAIVKP